MKEIPLLADGKKVGEVIEVRWDERGVSWTARVDDPEVCRRLLGTTDGLAFGNDRSPRTGSDRS